MLMSINEMGDKQEIFILLSLFFIFYVLSISRSEKRNILYSRFLLFWAILTPVVSTLNRPSNLLNEILGSQDHLDSNFNASREDEDNKALVPATGIDLNVFNHTILNSTNSCLVTKHTSSPKGDSTESCVLSESIDKEVLKHSVLSDVSKKSTVKSKNYKLLRDIHKSLAGNKFYADRSCKNHCGISNECSCKPICLFLKTCCIDFLEACADFLNINNALDGFSWLNSVDKECHSISLVVKSCRVLKENVINIPVLSNRSYANSLISQIDRFNQTGTIASIDILKLLITIPEKEMKHLGKLERIMISTPVLDTSTGISYRNISIFMCNQGNIKHAKLWSHYTEIEKPLNRPKIQTDDLNKILSQFILKSNGCIRSLSAFKLKMAYTEHCHNQAIQLCPSGYPDNDVREACEKVNFLISVRRYQNNSSNIVTEIYKNLFCLHCNLGFGMPLENIELISINYGTYTANLCKPPMLSFNFDLYSPHGELLTLTYFDTPGIYVTVWSDVGCSVHLSSSYYFERDTNNSTGESDDFSDVMSLELQTKCRVSRCRYIDCLARNEAIVGLPVPRYKIKDNFIQDLLNKILAVSIQQFPVPENTNKSITLWHVYDPPYSVQGNSYAYALYFRFIAHLGARDDVLTSTLKESVTDVLMQHYPFHRDRAYACITGITLGFKVSATIHCPRKHVFPIPFQNNGVSKVNLALTQKSVTLLITVVTVKFFLWI